MTLWKINDVNNKMEAFCLFVLMISSVFNIVLLATPTKLHDTLWIVIFGVLFLIPTLLALGITLIDFPRGWIKMIRRDKSYSRSTSLKDVDSQVFHNVQCCFTRL